MIRWTMSGVYFIIEAYMKSLSVYGCKIVTSARNFPEYSSNILIRSWMRISYRRSLVHDQWVQKLFIYFFSI